MHWKEMLINLERSCYLIVIMAAVAFLVLAAGIARYKSMGTLKILLVQAAATVLQLITDSFTYIDCIYTKNDLKSKIQPISEYVFFVFEFTACTTYILLNIQNHRVRRIIVIYSTIAFFAASIIFWNTPISFTSSNIVFAIENIALSISCLLYFINLFRQPPTQQLLQLPAFWAISGMLLLFSIGTPLFLFFNLLGYRFALEKVYLLNYILYIILYLTYLKAIQCHAANTKQQH